MANAKTLPSQKERIRFKLATTITVDGKLMMNRNDSKLWKVGDTKFKLTSGNGWVYNHLKKFRSQGIIVKCWIRDDGVLLSVRAGQTWSYV
jgi:hypothetical protein